MGGTQNQGEQELYVVRPGHRVVILKDVCFINKLPPELLSRIFAFVIGSHLDNEDDSGTSEYQWTNLAEEETGREAEAETEEEGKWGSEDDGHSQASGSAKTESSGNLVRYPACNMIPSSVCRHWRNIAISTPSLWTTIVLCPTSGRSYEVLPMLLERSKCLPIDVWINCNDDDFGDNADPPSDAEFRSTLSKLVPHIHRWRVVNVTVSHYYLMHVFLSAVSDPSIPAAPQLTSLSLCHHEGVNPENLETFWYPHMSMSYTLFGGSTPLLREVTFWGVHVAWGWLASASNLTDVIFTHHTEDVRPSWAQFGSILQSAPNLKLLSLRISGPSGEPTELIPGAHEHPIQLLQLTDFQLAYRSPACAIGLLRRLYLPSLKHLGLDFLVGDYTDFVHELAGPAMCLSPAWERPPGLLSRLDRLELGGLPCRDDCVETLYGELQNLRSLKLDMDFLPSSFLSVLSKTRTLAGRCDVWLPRLKMLYATGDRVSDMANLLCEVVRKRREAGAPLSTLYLEEHPRLKKMHMDDLRENVTSIKIFSGLGTPCGWS